MNLRVKNAINEAKSYAVWILSAIAIIVLFKVGLSSEPFEFSVFSERLAVVCLILIPLVYLLLFLGFYFDLINKNNDSE